MTAGDKCFVICHSNMSMLSTRKYNVSKLSVNMDTLRKRVHAMDMSAFPCRFHGSVDRRGIAQLDLPFWNIKLGRHSETASGFHRAGCGHVIQCAA
jgi:hypothetical protein